MASKKIITVFGATGKQGGSVVRSILSDPTATSQFHVRAVTRDLSKDGAKSLASLGAEVVFVNIVPNRHYVTRSLTVSRVT